MDKIFFVREYRRYITLLEFDTYKYFSLSKRIMKDFCGYDFRSYINIPNLSMSFDDRIYSQTKGNPFQPALTATILI